MKDKTIQAGFSDFDKNVESPNENKKTSIRFTVNAPIETKVLLMQLQAVLQQDRVPEKYSLGKTLGEALEVFAEEIDFEKLKKKHKKHVEYITPDYVKNKGR